MLCSYMLSMHSTSACYMGTHEQLQSCDTARLVCTLVFEFRMDSEGMQFVEVAVML